MTKRPMHFVRHAMIDPTGKVMIAIVVTPPMEQEQAQSYKDWYEKEDCHVRHQMGKAMRASCIGPELTEVVILFETTLYGG